MAVSVYLSVVYMCVYVFVNLSISRRNVSMQNMEVSLNAFYVLFRVLHLTCYSSTLTGQFQPFSLTIICSTSILHFSSPSSVVTLIITPFYFAVRLFKRRQSNTILLTGLSGSGKTVLFYQVNIKLAV